MPLYSVAIIVICLAVALALLTSLFLRFRRYEQRWSPAITLDQAVQELEQERKKASNEFETMRNVYAAKRKIYDDLRSELAIFDERLAFAELGVYEPHFDFGDSASYKAAIREVRQEQKDLIQAKLAVVARTNWQVDGSRSKGKTMSNRVVRLTLRAFNNECDVAIANARWNNVNAMEKRIEKAADQIDKMNESNDVRIQASYLRLKLKELHLTHEYREKQKVERDERAEQARLEREEKRLIRDAENAAREEAKYQQRLEQARVEAQAAVGTSAEQFQQRIAELEVQLAAAHEKSERAKALAQITRSGYVYIISNVGSFGKNVVKIGMTRRLDPDDRVRELGDASVPFRFDTHAIIYAEDAPALETALHNRFDARRLNRANSRKEFFKATIGEVRDAVSELAPNATFHEDIEAQELRETIAMRAREIETRQQRKSPFPDTL